MSTQRNFPGAERRRPPAKRRGPRKCCHANDRPEQYSQPDPLGFSAPSHMGGQFDEHGYGSGHGPIGFTQHVLP